jgi:hypothetical protein
VQIAWEPGTRSLADISSSLSHFALHHESDAEVDEYEMVPGRDTLSVTLLLREAGQGAALELAIAALLADI